MFIYSNAVCRKISKSMAAEGLRLEEPTEPVDLNLATRQHEKYLQALREAGITNITLLESDETIPDCVFVEDTAVVIGDTALITNPGAESRRPEVEAIKKHFQNEKCMQTIVMNSPACCDGGDVLFTGKEIFVGLSRRTNKGGVEIIKKAFPNFPVHAISVGNSTLHLKSFMSMAGENTIIFGESDDAVSAKELVLANATVKYQVVTVPDDSAANCVYVNGVLIHRSKEEYPKCFDIFRSLPNDKAIGLNASEFAKVDGSWTCCSILY